MRLILASFLSFTLTASMASAEFRAGASAVDITPEKWPVSLAGSFSDRPATKAWDPIHARALVLDDGSTRLVIVIIDSCYVPRHILDEAKRRVAEKSKIRTDHQLMAATHTHSAPTSKDNPSIGFMASRDYLKQLTDGLVEAVLQAESRLRPAELAWGKTEVPEHVHNRRWHMKPGGILPNPFGEMTDEVRMNPPRASAILDRPAGPTDPVIHFLSVRGKDGAAIALLANYSLHYVGGVPAGGVSADYFGEFANRIEEALSKEKKGPHPVVGIMSNGTSGDVNNINFREPGQRKEPFEQIKLVAGRCAEAVLEAHRDVTFTDQVPLAMAQRELELKLRKPTPEQLKQAKEHLAAENEKELPIRAKAYARRAISLAEGPDTESIILQTLKIGDVGIATIPCEVFTETGLEIRRKSPLKPTFTIELANGHYGYLPTPRQHRLGGYETWLGSNILEIEASDKITASLLEMFNEIAK